MSKVTYEEVVKSLEIIGDIAFYNEDEEEKKIKIKDYWEGEYNLIKAFINQHNPQTFGLVTDSEGLHYPTYIEFDDIDETSELSEPQNIISHKALLDEIHETYKEKNQKYGDSFTETVEKYGLIAAITRMHDKFSRIENIITQKAEDDVEERLSDSLKDLANYCLMTVMVLGNEDE